MKGKTLTLCAGLCVVFLVVPAHAQRWHDTPKEIAEDLDRTKEKVKQLEKTVEELKTDTEYSSATVADDSHWREEVKRLRESVAALRKENEALKRMLAVRGAPPVPQVPKGAKAPDGTPLRFHQDVLEKATSLRLTEPLITQLQLQKGLSDFEKWTAGDKLVGRKVDWVLVLAEAKDSRSNDRLREITRRVQEAQREQFRALQLLEAAGAKKVMRAYTSADKRKEIESCRKKAEMWRVRLAKASEELVDEQGYWVKVTATPPGQPSIRIVASVHKDDLEFVARLPVGGTLRLRGVIGRIRCERERIGEPEFPIELVRCRAAKTISQ